MSRRYIVATAVGAALALSVLRFRSVRPASPKRQTVLRSSNYSVQSAVRFALDSAVDPQADSLAPVPLPDVWPPAAAPSVPLTGSRHTFVLVQNSERPAVTSTARRGGHVAISTGLRDRSMGTSTAVRRAVGQPERLPSNGAATSRDAQLQAILGAAPAEHRSTLQQLARRATQLRLFIYPCPRRASWSAANLTAQFPSCKTFQWSGDWELTERVRSTGQSTVDGDSADFFIVPFLSKCYYNNVARYRLRSMDKALHEVIAFLRQSPWWDKRPERHLFFFMSGVGAGIVPSWHAHIARSIFIVAEGDSEATYFRHGVDIVVPGKVGVGTLAHQRPAAKRTLLASFRGSLDAALRDADGGRVRKENKLRRRLAKMLEDVDDIIFSGHKSKKYVSEMDNSRFCIIPRGNTPWTRRFFDAAIRGCIPAVLSDPVAFPFEQFIDYTQMTIK